MNWLLSFLNVLPPDPEAVRAWIAERIRSGKNSPADEQIIEAQNWIDTVLREQQQHLTPTHV